MAQAMTLVGLDVRARQTHAAVLDRESGELRSCRLRMAPEEVVGFLVGLRAPVVAVYEAGPTGFGLARAGAERGIDLRVVAPGSIPKGSGDRVKTDRRDAIRLVRLLAAGELSFAFVPTVADEAFRDLIRCIEDLRGDLMRARHRLSKFLLRRGHRYEQGLEQTVPGCSHAPTVGRLRCFRGIETLTAAGLCAETGGFGRFPRPTMLSGFLGIVPSERTSDLKRRQGSITKAGSPHARRLLVEAAHHYCKAPAITQTLTRRQAGQDPRVIEIAWRAQRRLHARWQHLHTERKKPAGVVAIAVARELAAFLWEAAKLD
jgi:transposase